MRRIDTSNFSDVIISQLQQSTDAQFFSSLLGNFHMLHGDDSLHKLLDDLKVPLEVRKDPNEKKDEKGETKKDTPTNQALGLSQYIHQSIRAIYAQTIKSQLLYDGGFLQAFKILNNRLETYCKTQLGEPGKGEYDAIELLFEQKKTENIFGFARGSETEKGQEEGLKMLFGGLIKYYRNPDAHQKGFFENVDDFVYAMILLSMLFKRMDKVKSM